MIRRVSLVLTFVCAAVLPTHAADTLYLRNGDRLTGQLQKLEGGRATVQPSYADHVTVQTEAIRAFGTVGPVTVRLDEDEYLRGTVSVLEGERMRIVHPTRDRESTFVMGDVRGVYRQKPGEIQRQKQAVRWRGNANLGVDVTRGNSNQERYHFDGQIEARAPGSRYSLYAEYNQREEEGVETEKNVLGRIKYDYFVSQRFFLFNSVSAEHDPFDDLDLRSSLGVGLGYQVYETDRRQLSFEGGVSYVDENFITAPDQHGFGGRYALDYWQLLTDHLRLFHYQEGVSGSEADFLLRSRTGLRSVLTEGLQATAQVNLDWEASPVPGTASTDTKYILSLGYNF